LTPQDFRWQTLRRLMRAARLLLELALTRDLPPREQLPAT
jgi:hypothetical protein